MGNAPDPAEDFDGFIDRAVKDAMAEMAGIPKHMRNRYYLRKAMDAVTRALDGDYPQIILSQQLQRLARNVQRLHAEIPAESHWHDLPDDVEDDQ
ncbi:hypothetical protein [Sphingobium sp. YC-XJ3]|uniref:hypothetical protein n=1 Tax=Sphingobium sp. YC-XJ3 TaxID=3024245 RepID=UPI0023628FD1|nr:hypothetical protein [Sphingobium sp. YC-XJ3]WDA36448.1 hypothetical protein PO876_23965 [Sphingobium sp. YC-XJ3]WDA37822.1 hypothetical protein PO876_06485 [Sphingobium sp. YC-XJ3]